VTVQVAGSKMPWTWGLIAAVFIENSFSVRFTIIY